MKDRVGNPDYANFDNYGGRGVTVCDDWYVYDNFKHWALANGYADDLTLDRIDNDGHYEPANCRWATRKEQQRNRRCAKLTPEMVKAILKDTRSQRMMAPDYGVSQTMISRIKTGRQWADDK